MLKCRSCQIPPFPQPAALRYKGRTNSRPASHLRARVSVHANGKDEAAEWERWEDASSSGSLQDAVTEEQLLTSTEEEEAVADSDLPFDWRAELQKLEERNQQPKDAATAVNEPEKWEDVTVEEWQETAFLVGVSSKGRQDRTGYSITESLDELARLANSAGLQVVGRMEQQLEVSSRTYVGSGKLKELQAAVAAAEADTLIFDDELKPGQMRALERELGPDVSLCDRTALILDIFSQRAASREGQLQVELAQCDYQLPRLTRMWSHLERQAGGRVRGMGEKQLEIDKRLLRARMARLRLNLDDTRRHRRQSREKRAEASKPVLALCGYTNAGKSTLLNRLTDATVMTRDVLFATLDPTTRRLTLPSGREVLLSDTVGFIQKLPTQLVAAFRATLEEIKEAQLLVHVVDVSHPNAAAQSEAVMQVLEELGAQDLPLVTVWNKVDACAQPDKIKQIAAKRSCTVAVSATSGDGIPQLLAVLEDQLSQQLTDVHCLVPYSQGDLLDELHRQGTIQQEEFAATGTLVAASVPASLANRLGPLLLDASRYERASAELQAQTG